MKTNLHWASLLLSVLIVIASACSKNDTTGNKQLELVFEDSTYQFTGLAKEQNGRLMVNYPRWSPIYQYAVIEAQGRLVFINVFNFINRAWKFTKKAFPVMELAPWVNSQPKVLHMERL